MEMHFYRLHPRLIGQAVTMNPSLMADMDKTWNVNIKQALPYFGFQPICDMSLCISASSHYPPRTEEHPTFTTSQATKPQPRCLTKIWPDN